MVDVVAQALVVGTESTLIRRTEFRLTNRLLLSMFVTSAVLHTHIIVIYLHIRSGFMDDKKRRPDDDPKFLTRTVS